MPGASDRRSGVTNRSLARRSTRVPAGRCFGSGRPTRVECTLLCESSSPDSNFVNQQQGERIMASIRKYGSRPIGRRTGALVAMSALSLVVAVVDADATRVACDPAIVGGV